ncbi:MAG: carbon-nitrogen hydrolase [Lentisphaerae bacterium]|jgi:N-carbamoylputrescine amidase|nr:carbon-nitrogen hydrolase [Lentisphaerota bacterium]
MSNDKTMTIALLQGRGYKDSAEAIAATEQQIAIAAARGACVICTQELFLTEYFCRVQDQANFALAESIPGPSTEHFAAVARKHEVVLILSLFERRASGLYHNTAVIIDADGQIAGIYRKMHIPQDPGFEEKFYFTPGDLGFRAFDTAYGRIGVIICWDQWYPEAARLTALRGANVIFCPTAIGGLACEGPELAQQQRDAWLNVQRGHAVANGCYYAAVNRVGTEYETRFWGTSFVADFYGNAIAQASQEDEEVLLATCDFQAQETHRQMWPFFRDRRIDMYQDITKRFLD